MIDAVLLDPRPTRETDVLSDIRRALSEQPDVRVMRNNVGVTKTPDALARAAIDALRKRNWLPAAAASLAFSVARDSLARLLGPSIRYGLGIGSPDLVCMVRITTASWGPVARWLCIEVKRPGHRTSKERLANQAAWIKSARDMGAVAGFAESVEDAMTLLREARGE